MCIISHPVYPTPKQQHRPWRTQLVSIHIALIVNAHALVTTGEVSLVAAVVLAHVPGMMFI
jgi:hypothetical protein